MATMEVDEMVETGISSVLKRMRSKDPNIYFEHDAKSRDGNKTLIFLYEKSNPERNGASEYEWKPVCRIDEKKKEAYFTAGFKDRADLDPQLLRLAEHLNGYKTNLPVWEEDTTNGGWSWGSAKRKKSDFVEPDFGLPPEIFGYGSRERDLLWGYRNGEPKNSGTEECLDWRGDGEIGFGD